MRVNIAYLSLFVVAMSACSAASYAATPPAHSSPRQRVVISDDYTSTLASQLGVNGLRIRSPTKREKSRSALHNSLTLCSKQVAAMRAS